MVVGRTFASSDRRALLASVALHALAIVLAAAFIRREFGLDTQPGLDTVIHIEQRIAVERLLAPVPHGAAHPAPARAVPRPPDRVDATTGPLLAARAAAPPAAGTRNAPHTVTTAVPAVKAPAARTVAMAVEPAVPALQHQALTATPPPTPAPPPAAGGFAQNHPAIFWDAHALDDLRATLGSFAIVIEVDEYGRAQDIEFIRPLSDPSLRDAVVARLMAARYIPAQCDGLDCPGEVPFHS